MDNLKFYLALIFITLLIFFFGFYALELIKNFGLSAILLSQCANILGGSIFIGLGLGLPIVLLATIFGWIQLVLLVSGNISPHLAREGFFKVLKTLSSKF